LRKAQKLAFPLIGNRAAKLRVSLHADDAAVFLKPVREEVYVVAQVLELFGKASGLDHKSCKVCRIPDSLRRR
jgi:hypothetical protein